MEENTIVDMAFKVYNECVGKPIFGKVKYIFNYIEEEYITNMDYKKTIFDIAFNLEELNETQLSMVISHYKYIYNNEKLVFNMYQNLLNQYGKEKYFDVFYSRLLERELFEKEKYRMSSKELDELTSYSNDYIYFLKGIMISDFIDIDTIKSILPSSILVNEDEKQAKILSYLYGGYQIPLSYELTYKAALNEDLSNIKLAYRTPEGYKPATFILEDFQNIKKTIKK